MTNDFNFKKFEKEAQEKWKKIDAFKFNNSSKRPYYVLEQFPYPSGNMHMGHLRCYTIGDAIARFRRLQGYNVLHPFGFDAFGLPAENAAIDNGINPSIWTDKNIEKILNDINKLGMSIDEDRIIKTCDPRYYKFEQKMFLDFVKNGIAYQKESIVNWDPVDHTVLANEQVIDGKGWRSGAVVEKKKLKQWYLKITKYADDLLNCLEKSLPEWPNKVKIMQQNWINKSYGTIIKFNSSFGNIDIFTTRPDTFFGCSFIGISPFHPLAKKIAETNKEVAKFISQCEKDQMKGIEAKENKEKKGIFTGINCKHHLTGKDIPVWIANFVLMDYGTGAIFGCPAHDERDKEFCDKYGMTYFKVIDDNNKLINSGKFNNLTSEEAKKEITKELKKLGCGEEKIMYKLRDWGISRQRYWGCPIPMVYCDKCGCVPEKEENLPITLPVDVEFDGKGNPLDKHPTWKYCKCPVCGNNATRETDTFDTFFESSWYFFRYLSPNDNKKPFNAEDIKNIMPVQDYIGGIEHAILHLLYSRFFTKALSDCGYFTKNDLQDLEPFRRLITQGMVLHEAFKDKNGKWVEASKVIKKDGKYIFNEEEVFSVGIEKMSKSKKNVVSPVEIFDKYGADSSRMFILSDTPYEKEFEWTDAGVKGVYKYLQKIWSFASLVKEKDGIENSEIIKQMHRFLNSYINCFKRFEFNVAIAKLREFTNFLGEINFNDKNNNYTLGVVMKNLSICLSPICPHLSEAIFEQLGDKDICCQQKLPEVDQKYLEETTMQVSIAINGKFKLCITLDKSLEQNEIIEKAKKQNKIANLIDKKEIKKVIVANSKTGKMVNFVIVN